MKGIETIRVTYLHPKVDFVEGKYCLQFAGFSDKPSKLGYLQAWSMPMLDKASAEEKHKEMSDGIKKIGQLIVFYDNRKR